MQCLLCDKVYNGVDDWIGRAHISDHEHSPARRPPPVEGRYTCAEPWCPATWTLGEGWHVEPEDRQDAGTDATPSSVVTCAETVNVDDLTVIAYASEYQVVRDRSGGTYLRIGYRSRGAAKCGYVRMTDAE
jgi:hypothetical protein